MVRYLCVTPYKAGRSRLGYGWVGLFTADEWSYDAIAWSCYRIGDLDSLNDALLSLGDVSVQLDGRPAGPLFVGDPADVSPHAAAFRRFG